MVEYYCGWIGQGFLGTPQNSFFSIAFWAGAVYAWRIWRVSARKDFWQFVLILLIAGIGVCSFIFHSKPTEQTLLLELIPIQIFGLTFLGYILLEYFHLSDMWTGLVIVVFFFVRQLWIIATPRGELGGGITHILTILLLVILTFFIAWRGFLLWRYMAVATVTYLLAFVAQASDLSLSPYFSWGIHWVWHLLTAVTASLLVIGILRSPPDSWESSC